MPIRSRGNCEMTRKRMVQVSSRPDSDALKRNGMQRHAMTWRRKGIVRGGKRPEPSTRHHYSACREPLTAGLAGSKRREEFNALFAADPARPSGAISVPSLLMPRSRPARLARRRIRWQRL